MENLTTPLMRFPVPSATSPTNATPSFERTTALSLSQTLDGLSIRRLACLVSCRRRPWDSKRVGESHLNCAESQSSKEAHAIRSPGEPNCLAQCFTIKHQLTIPLQRSPLTTPPPKGWSSDARLQPKLPPWTAHAQPPKRPCCKRERTSRVHQLSCRNSLTCAVAPAPQPRLLHPCSAPAPRRSALPVRSLETYAETCAPSIAPHRSRSLGRCEHARHFTRQTS
jgi:hypothetical protein